MELERDRNNEVCGRQKLWKERAGRRKAIILENNEIQHREYKKRFGRKKNRQMERREKRRETTERREIWFVVVTVADPSLVLPSCNSDSSVPLLL